MSPEKARRSYSEREGHASQLEGARSSSSNVRSVREGHASQQEVSSVRSVREGHASQLSAPPLWSGPSSSSQIVPRVRSVREGHASQQFNSAFQFVRVMPHLQKLPPSCYFLTHMAQHAA